MPSPKFLIKISNNIAEIIFIILRRKTQTIPIAKLVIANLKDKFLYITKYGNKINYNHRITITRLIA